MKMPCRITDENVYNPWEDDAAEELEVVKTLEECSVYDLMGQEHQVWVGKNTKFGYVLEIENEDGQKISESQIHPCAMESLATFCRQFLNNFDRINGDLSDAPYESRAFRPGRMSIR